MYVQHSLTIYLPKSRYLWYPTRYAQICLYSRTVKKKQKTVVWKTENLNVEIKKAKTENSNVEIQKAIK